MKKIFIFFILLKQIHVFGQSSTLIEPSGNNGILSKNVTTVSSDVGSIALPISGAGTRLMWIPAKSAFRVGTVTGPYWDSNDIGTWSIASGLNAVASGRMSGAFGDGSIASGYASFVFGGNLTASSYYSIAMGYSSQATNINSFAVGDRVFATGLASIAMGTLTTSNGDYAMAAGNETTASGNTSTALGGFNTASGAYSTALGGFNIASGNISTTLGAGLTAQSYASLVTGRYNIIGGTKSSWINTEPLLIVGNGSSETSPNNALTLLKNSNLGLNTATPQYQLTFKDDLGDKISLYSGNTSNTTSHYGIGIQAARFQIFTPSTNDAIVFGTGRSAAFTENIRFTGNGLVGIGINAPSELLDVNGRMRIRHKPGNTAGVWMSNSLNSTAVSDGAFYGMKSDTEAGIFFGGAWRFGVTNTGVVSASGGISVGGGETISKIKKTSVTYNIPSIPANSSILDTFTIGDLSSTDNIIVNPDGTIFPLVIAYTRYIASTVMEIVFYNPTNVAVDIPSRTFNITVIK